MEPCSRGFSFFRKYSRAKKTREALGHAGLGDFINRLSQRLANAEDNAITGAIIAMGRSLSLTVIAEGVETAEQLDFLRAHACDEFQGFYCSKAVPAVEFMELLKAQK